jgi:hypothetical protein
MLTCELLSGVCRGFSGVWWFEQHFTHTRTNTHLSIVTAAFAVSLYLYRRRTHIHAHHIQQSALSWLEPPLVAKAPSPPPVISASAAVLASSAEELLAPGGLTPTLAAPLWFKWQELETVCSFSWPSVSRWDEVRGTLHTETEECEGGEQSGGRHRKYDPVAKAAPWRGGDVKPYLYCRKVIFVLKGQRGEPITCWPLMGSCNEIRYEECSAHTLSTERTCIDSHHVLTSPS